MLAFVDKNRDLFLTRLRFRPTTGGPSNLPQSAKLGSMVQSMQWNIECNMLATIRVRKSSLMMSVEDGCLFICPSANLRNREREIKSERLYKLQMDSLHDYFHIGC